MSSFQSHHNRRASARRMTHSRRMSEAQMATEQEALASVGKKKRKAKDTQKAALTREETTNRVTRVNQYKVVKPLGKGAFGEVYKVASGDGDYAMKILKKLALQRQRQGRFGSALDSVKIEIATMKLLDHPNCVHMYEVVIDPQHDEIVLTQVTDSAPTISTVGSREAIRRRSGRGVGPSQLPSPTRGRGACLGGSISPGGLSPFGRCGRRAHCVCSRCLYPPLCVLQVLIPPHCVCSRSSPPTRVGSR